MGTSVQPGRKNKLYYNNRANTASAGAGTHAVPVWKIIDRVGDVNRTGTKNSTDIDMRASESTITVYGNKSREITFSYYKLKGATDVVFNTLKKSFEEDLVLDIIMLEDAVTVVGTVGVRGPFIVSQMDKSEPIQGVETYDITMKFADDEISAGVPFLFDHNFVTV